MKFVRDVMTANPLYVGPEDSIQQAARVMRDADIGALPVVDSSDVDDTGMLVGIVTDRDIVVKAIAAGRDLGTPVRQCMSSDPESVPPDTPLNQALKVMTTHQVRRLPVVEFGRLLGMLALADISGGEAGAEEEARVLQGVSSVADKRPAADEFDL